MRYYVNSTGCPSEVVSKVACVVRQSLSGQAPLYLAHDCCLVSDSTRHSLRSADILTGVVPQKFSSYIDRTFAVAGPRLWNSLPVQLHSLDITALLSVILSLNCTASLLTYNHPFHTFQHVILDVTVFLSSISCVYLFTVCFTTRITATSTLCLKNRAHL